MNGKPSAEEGQRPEQELTEIHKIPPDAIIKNFIPEINLDGLKNQDGVLVGDTHTNGTTSSAIGMEIVLGHFSRIKSIADIDSNEGRQMKELLQRFAGGIIVDLGAGMSELAYIFSQNLKAGGYVGVEPVYSAELQNNVQTQADKNKKSESAIPFVVVAENMLKFLKRLPDGSASVLASNIDLHVIPNKKILEEIGREIDRVIGTKNAFVINHSEIPLPSNQSYRIVYKNELPGVQAFDDTRGGFNGKLYEMSVIVKDK
ncbi:MAG: hypothetical protein WA057_03775 [Candidatus Magasanikiibacteriota bacterium]